MALFIEICNMCSVMATSLLCAYCLLRLKSYHLSVPFIFFTCCFIYEHLLRNKTMRFYYFIFLCLNIIYWVLRFKG